MEKAEGARNLRRFLGNGAIWEGVAVSIALSDPDLFNGQTFALKGNWGSFEGSNALGFTAKGLSPEFAGDALATNDERRSRLRAE